MSRLLFFAISMMLITYSHPIAPETIRKGNDARFYVVGGRDVDWGEAFFQVSLRLMPQDNTFGRGHYCAGVLIKYHVVLTAAQCFFYVQKLIDKKDLRIVGGNYMREIKNSTTYVGEARALIHHPKFNPTSSFDHDIGLVLLIDPVCSKHTTLKPIALEESFVSSGTAARMYGWGFQSVTSNELPNRLQVGTTEIISKEICRAKFDLALGKNIICTAGAPMASSCKGDSGGPLICNNHLVGLTTFGTGCGVPDIPTAFTEIRPYVDWIRKNDSRKLKGSLKYLIIQYLTYLIWI